MADAELKAAHLHSSQHRDEIGRSRLCGCFYCKQTFTPAQIDEWIDDGACAMCPLCGIDSVIGDASGLPVGSPAFLADMHEFWFERTVRIG
jgi:hypothetical protein